MFTTHLLHVYYAFTTCLLCIYYMFTTLLFSLLNKLRIFQQYRVFISHCHQCSYFFWLQITDAERVLSRSHRLAGMTLRVTPFIVQPTCDEDHSDCDRRTLEVSGFSFGTSSERLRLYFENERNDGGPVEEVKVDQVLGVAWVTFDQEHGETPYNIVTQVENNFCQIRNHRLCYICVLLRMLVAVSRM